MRPSGKVISESMIGSLRDYFALEINNFNLSFWTSVKLIPFKLTENKFQWVKAQLN